MTDCQEEDGTAEKDGYLHILCIVFFPLGHTCVQAEVEEVLMTFLCKFNNTGFYRQSCIGLVTCVDG